MINIRQFLLSLLPVISDRPPPVFLTPTFAAAVSDSSGNFSHVIDCKVAEAKQNYNPQPRPEIGGQRITEDWLHSLKESDCLWRFRYVATYCLLEIKLMLNLG
jgi:hypothetical protein